MVRFFFFLQGLTEDGFLVSVASEVVRIRKVAKICHSHIHLRRLIGLSFFQRGNDRSFEDMSYELLKGLYQHKKGSRRLCAVSMAPAVQSGMGSQHRQNHAEPTKERPFAPSNVSKVGTTGYVDHSILQSSDTPA
jgi:hypothetical protein